MLAVLNSRDALHLKTHLPSAAAAKEGDDDDDGRDADEDVGGGVVDVQVKPLNLLPCNIFRLQQLSLLSTLVKKYYHNLVKEVEKLGGVDCNPDRDSKDNDPGNLKLFFYYL